MSVWPVFVLWELDGCEHEYNVLWLHPTRGSPNNVCLVANAWYHCSTRYDMRSEFGISARERPSGKKRQTLCNFAAAGQESGPPAGSCKFEKNIEETTRGS